jgi:alkyl hydroperoxide reductase subunit F
MQDLIILGGGPAGLTATMYAVQKRLDALLITRDLGGKTNYMLQLPFVERHMVINGDEVVSRFSREIEYLDFIRVMENAEKITAIEGGYEIATTGGGTYQTRALIVATGAKGQLLNVPGEHEFMMRGLCYSALSYAQLFIDRDVVVIGDGYLALRGVAELARNARNVKLVAGLPNDLDTPIGRRLRVLPQVEFLEGYQVVEVKGDTYARSVVVKGTDGERELFADAIFVERDLIPRTQLVAHLVDLDKKGHIQINSRNETSAQGIYAAGDVTDTFSEQVLVSIGEGAKAALSAYEYLLNHEPVKQMA